MNKRQVVMIITAVFIILSVLTSGITGSSFLQSASAADRFYQDVEGDSEITWNPRTGTPSFVRAEVPFKHLGIINESDPEKAALAYLNQYRDLFGIQQASDELMVVGTQVDQLGFKHVILSQLYKGVPVYAASVKVHLGADGASVIAVSNGYIPNIQIQNVQASVTSAAAHATALKDMPAGKLAVDPRMMVYPGRDDAPGISAHLAWLVELRDDSVPAHNLYVIDALDGKLIDVIQKLNTEEFPATLRNTPQKELAAIDAIDCDPQVFEGVWHCTAHAGQTHLIIVDLDNPKVQVQTVLSNGPSGECNSVNFNPRDGTSNCFYPYPFETMSHMLSRYVSRGAVAVINTDYFGMDGDHGAEGFAVRNGIRLDGLAHNDTDGNAVNRSSLAISEAKTAQIGKLSSESEADPTGRHYNVVAGGPTIVSQGQPLGNDACSQDGLSSTVCTRTAQSAAGLTSDGLLFLLTANGLDAAGVASYLTTEESLQAESAIKFDGGGSARLAWLDASGNIQSFGGTSEDRAVAEGLVIFSARIPEARNRLTYNANHSYSLPGTLARSENDPPTRDADVDNAHDFAGETYNYYFDTHARNSYNDLGGTMTSTVHLGSNYMNAYWNGEQTAFGDGFPVKDVVAHEWTHAVIQYTANLEYRWQSGALNESFADIFGAMVDRDDWLMGEDLSSTVLGGRDAIRDLADPARLGQPAHTDDWVETCSDNEGVHTNSGITNKAYYNIASAIGKDKAERVFYRALTVYLHETSSLEDARAGAMQAAVDLYGTESAEYGAVENGFNAVGLDGVWNPPSNCCVCGGCVALTGEAGGDGLLTQLREVRDQVFTQNPGQRWVSIYYEHQFEVAWLLITDSQLRANVATGFTAYVPVFSALLGETDQSVFLTVELIEEAERNLMEVAEKSSPQVHDQIVREWARVNPYRFVGWDVNDVWDQLRLEEQSKLFLPILTLK